MQQRIFLALAIVVLAAGAALASEEDVLVPVHQFVDAINKGDTKTAVAACASQTSILDEFPPYEWHGAGACSSWANDFALDAKKNGITDAVLTLGKPLHVDVTAGRAYVVAPADFAFNQNGKPVKETGARFTFALHRTEDGWRITGWAWAKP